MASPVISNSNMLTTGTRVIAGVLAALSTSAFGLGQGKDAEPIKTTLCVVVENPERFSGKRIQVRAIAEIGSLRDNVCAERDKDHFGSRGAEIMWDFGGPPNTPCGSLGPAVSPDAVRENSQFLKMLRYVTKVYTSEWGEVCYRCPLYTVIVDATGRFEHVDRTKARSEQPVCLGFGHLDIYTSRLVLESVSHVTADAIDPAIYKYRFPLRPEIGEPPVIR